MPSTLHHTSVRTPRLEDLDATDRAVAEEIIAATKARIVTEASRADEDATTPFGRFMLTRTPSQRAAVRSRTRAIVRRPVLRLEEEFGRHAVDIGPLVLTTTTKAKPKLKLTLPPEVKQELEAKIAAAKAKKAAAAKAAADVAAGLTFRRLELTITKVTCNDTSGGWGSDEFSMGGETMSPTAATTKVAEFEVMTDADPGEVVHPNRVFGSWKLDTGDVWPKDYVAILTAAEKDGGGFADYLHQLWQQVGDQAKVLIGAAAGALVGSVVPGLGNIVGAAVGAVIGWLFSLLDDDPMQVRTLTMTLAAATKSYYDWAKLTTAGGWTNRIWFGEDGSSYDVDLAWRVRT